MTYELHPEAEFEFLEAAARYETEVPGLGERFGDEVERAIDLLVEHPEIGARVQGEIRHFVLERFPFSIIYAAVPGLVYILAVAHHSRDPEYWSRRT